MNSAFFDLDLTDDESNPKFIRRCEAWAGLVLLYLLVDLGRRDGFGELGPSFDIGELHIRHANSDVSLLMQC